MNKIHRIAIVGAGVAGMALAILARRKGYYVRLYERDSRVSSIGAGVTLWPNAIFVLQQMGLEQEIKRIGGSPRFMRQFDRHGSQKSEFDIDEVNLLCEFPSVTVLRRDLMSRLSEALDNLGGEIHFDHSITPPDIHTLQQDFDLVVGADGRMNSVVRHTLFADKVYPQYQGFINILGISQLEDDRVDSVIHDYQDQGERFGIVPIKKGLCFWAGAWSAKIDKMRPVSDWYAEMNQRFMRWPEPVRNVLKSYDKASLNRIFVHDLDPLPYWHQNNVVIIGDAAHASLPTSGQGASQALEDAWHLIQLLDAKTGMDIASILNDFYQQRIAKTSVAQTVGRQAAQRIFGEHLQPNSLASGISAKQLSQLWMQGLEMD